MSDSFDRSQQDRLTRLEKAFQELRIVVATLAQHSSHTAGLMTAPATNSPPASPARRRYEQPAAAVRIPHDYDDFGR